MFSVFPEMFNKMILSISHSADDLGHCQWWWPVDNSRSLVSTINLDSLMLLWSVFWCKCTIYTVRSLVRLSTNGVHQFALTWRDSSEIRLEELVEYLGYTLLCILWLNGYRSKTRPSCRGTISKDCKICHEDFFFHLREINPVVVGLRASWHGFIISLI